MSTQVQRKRSNVFKSPLKSPSSYLQARLNCTHLMTRFSPPNVWFLDNRMCSNYYSVTAKGSLMRLTHCFGGINRESMSTRPSFFQVDREVLSIGVFFIIIRLFVNSSIESYEEDAGNAFTAAEALVDSLAIRPKSNEWQMNRDWGVSLSPRRRGFFRNWRYPSSILSSHRIFQCLN